MLDGRRRQSAILLLLPAAVVGVSLAGCTGSSSRHGAGASLSAAKADSFSASKLRGALLTRVNDVGASAAAASGAYTAISARVAGGRAGRTPEAAAAAAQA